MYIAVIELDTTIAPKVVLGYTVQVMNRRIAEILTDHGIFTPEIETILRQHPAPIDEPDALREWLQEFHDGFTQPWVSTYITIAGVSNARTEGFNRVVKPDRRQPQNSFTGSSQIT